MSSATQEDKYCQFTFYNTGMSNQTTLKCIKSSPADYFFFYNGLQSERVQTDIAEQKLEYIMNTYINQYERVKIDLYSPYPSVDFFSKDFKDFVKNGKTRSGFYLQMLG